MVRYIRDEIGRGSFGVTFAACSASDAAGCSHVAKVVPIPQVPNSIVERSFRLECVLCLHASDNGYGPKVQHTIICEGDEKSPKYGIIIMERLTDTMYNLQARGQLTPADCIQAASMMSRMHVAGIWHSDLHSNNIMYKELPNGKRTFVMIDFGMAWPLFQTVPTELKLADVMTWVEPSYLIRNRELVRNFPGLAEPCREAMFQWIDLQWGISRNSTVYKDIFAKRILDVQLLGDAATSQAMLDAAMLTTLQVGTDKPAEAPLHASQTPVYNRRVRDCASRVFDLYLDATEYVARAALETNGIDVYLQRVDNIQCDPRFPDYTKAVQRLRQAFEDEMKTSYV